MRRRCAIGLHETISASIVSKSAPVAKLERYQHEAISVTTAGGGRQRY